MNGQISTRFSPFPWRCLLFLLPVLAVSCERVDSLSNAADVTAVSITHHAPATILLGTPARVNDHTFAIPLLYGKYDFPLHLRLSVDVSEEAAKILSRRGGLFNPDDVVFEQFDDVVEFDVVAASGKVKHWQLRLLENILDEQTQIRQFDIVDCSPAEAVISRSASIRYSENEIVILALSPVFPLSITPAITLAGQNAQIGGYAPGDALSFAAIDATVTLQVKAESGKMQAWTVKLVQCRNASGQPALSIPTKNRLSLPPGGLSFELSQGAVREALQDFPAGVITLQVEGAAFPVTVKAHLPVHPAAHLAASPADTTFTFTQFGTAAEFYIVDTISACYKKWALRLSPYRHREADIKTFALAGLSSPITLDAPAINARNATVTLKITAGASHFPFTADIHTTLSDGAQLKGSPPDFTQAFTRLDSTYTLWVVAENGDEREWGVRFLNADPAYAAKRTGSDVTAFALLGYSSQQNPASGNKVELDPAAGIDAVTKTITLKITNWKRYFPLKLTAGLQLSSGATSTLDAAEELEFAAPDATRPFTVTAEDGSSTLWTIRFADEEPVKSSLAALTDFSVGNRLSANSAIDKIYIEPGKQQAVILLSQAQFPLRITPAIAVSPKACLLDINSGEEMLFSSFGEERNIRLMPEDESRIVTYKVILVNAPPLPNGALEEWSDGENAAGWANPNATGIVTMRRMTPGYANTGAAAQLTSSTATILGSIKVTAAGSMFLGRFDYQIMYASKPKLMTYFAIPWKARPVALEADYSYRRGAQLVNSNHDPVAGTDEGAATIELLHWAGNGAIKYHTIAPEDTYGQSGNEAESPGITVVARAKEDHLAPTAGWQQLRLNLVTLDASKTPNYMHLTFASSTRGDKQIGADGSVLALDNIRLVYYEPEEGSLVRN
ncbi:MAG: PCMD domain-containing protein [Prevotellaceae bacterium]|nr:PCMD domain-containing protein [Prevotellaceae bacterium]